MNGALDSAVGGLASGDVVFGVNHTPPPHAATCAAIDATRGGDPAVLHVERQGKRLYLPFTIE